MKIISRKNARIEGLKLYFTGKPCIRGGIATRMVVNGVCLCEACKSAERTAKREYMKANRGAATERQFRYRQRNPEKYSKANKERYERNKERISEQRLKHRINNKEKIIKRSKLYYEKNTEKILANKAKRRATKKQATPLWFGEFDEFVIHQAYELAVERLKETGIAWHVDHMVPLKARKACGLHCADNIQVIPAVMNLAKNNRMQLISRLEWLK